MPISEYREVRFDAAALRAALQVRLLEVNARQSQDGAPLAGTVVAASLARADPVQLALEIASPEGAQRGSITMEAVEVAAALIRACMQRGIRLPRNGAKSVKAVPGGVALVVTVTHAEGAAEPAQAGRTRAASRPSAVKATWSNPAPPRAGAIVPGAIDARPARCTTGRPAR